MMRPRRKQSKKADGQSVRWFWACLVLVALLGLWLRYPDLDKKPLHHDEANQAVKFGALLENEDYKYDPVDHHGPTLYYLTLPIAWLKGQGSLEEIDEWTIRLVPVAFGVGILLLPGLARGATGMAGALFASLLIATSPIFVYFSRYYVQEMPFVAFTMGALACLWRYQVSRARSWAVWFGICCGLMHATKETCVLSFAAMVAGGALLMIGPLKKNGKPALRKLGDPADAAWALRAWVVVGVVFFSSFFSHWEGVWNAFATHFHTVDRAGGQGHEKPFGWYMGILLNYREQGYGSNELPILVGCLVGVVFAFLDKPSEWRTKAMRFLSVYTLVVFLLYSLIPYKTPWLAMNFLLGAALLAGFGFDRLLHALRFNDAKVALCLVAAWALFQSHGRAILATRTYAADMRNPYAYVHTTDDFLRMVKEIRSLSNLHDLGNGCRVKVFTPTVAEHWPLPWYLRDFSRVTYFAGIPEDGYLDGELIIVHPDLKEALEKRLTKEYYDPYTDYSLREGITLNLIYSQKIRDTFLGSQP
jgi:uncharacterized protein (TIGR03663 family)